MPAAMVSTPTEAFSWVLINELRQDPAGFANQLDALRKGTIPSAFGFSKSDPVVADLNRLLQYSTYPGHYGSALKILRSTVPVGPLGWDDTLASRADMHTAWMKTHAFEHTGVNAPNPTYVAGFPTSYKSGSPDQWGYSGQFYWWGEDIGYTYGLMVSSKAAFSAGTIGRVGFQERAAFIDTVSYVLEVNSPDMAHLEQLIAPDGGPANGKPQFNAVGMNLEFYEGPNEVRDGLGEATISTHRFGFYQPGGSGGFITGVAYKDANGNGFYDAGEGIGATLRFSGPTTFTESLNRITTQGVSSNYVPNGTYTVTATAAERHTAWHAIGHHREPQRLVRFPRDRLGRPSGCGPGDEPECHDRGSANRLVERHRGRCRLSRALDQQSDRREHLSRSDRTRHLVDRDIGPRPGIHVPSGRAPVVLQSRWLVEPGIDLHGRRPDAIGPAGHHQLRDPRLHLDGRIRSDSLCPHHRRPDDRPAHRHRADDRLELGAQREVDQWSQIPMANRRPQRRGPGDVVDADGVSGERVEPLPRQPLPPR